MDEIAEDFPSQMTNADIKARFTDHQDCLKAAEKDIINNAESINSCNRAYLPSGTCCKKGVFEAACKVDDGTWTKEQSGGRKRRKTRRKSRRAGGRKRMYRVKAVKAWLKRTKRRRKKRKTKKKKKRKRRRTRR